MKGFEKYIFIMNVWMEDNACRYPNFLNSLKFIEQRWNNWINLYFSIFQLFKRKKNHSSQEIIYNEVVGI